MRERDRLKWGLVKTSLKTMSLLDSVNIKDF